MQLCFTYSIYFLYLLFASFIRFYHSSGVLAARARIEHVNILDRYQLKAELAEEGLVNGNAIFAHLSGVGRHKLRKSIWQKIKDKKAT